MIGADDQEIVVTHAIHEFRQALVEVLQCVGVTPDVAPVTVQHVEVDEVREDDGAVRRGRESLECGVEQGGIAGCLYLPRYTLVSVNIGNLADADDVATGRDEFVEYGR